VAPRRGGDVVTARMAFYGFSFGVILGLILWGLG
jgi:hypothetical protein